MISIESLKNKKRIRQRLLRVISAVALATMLSFAGYQNILASSAPTPEKVAFTVELPNAKGKRLTLITVSYGPGESSPRHKHAGSVVAYVLAGEIRSQNSATGPARVYKVGESFFEPPGSEHLISENASNSKPASLLAIFIADDNATLTQPAR